MLSLNPLELPPFTSRPMADRAAERVAPGAMLELELDVQFAAGGVTCHDSRLIPKSNLWRDYFPGGLDRQLLGLAVGARVAVDGGPGLLTDYQEGACFTAPRAAFRTRKLARRDLEPRLGRFYPRGFLAGQRGLFAEDRRPLRVTGLSEREIAIDSRHPLAAVPVQLGIRVLSTWQAGAEHGGMANDIALLAAGDGPGMQLPLAAGTPDFWYPRGPGPPGQPPGRGLLRAPAPGPPPRQSLPGPDRAALRVPDSTRGPGARSHVELGFPSRP